jgi:hydrogenase-4 component F
MILFALILVPAVAALLAFLRRAQARRDFWLVIGASLHLLLVARLWQRPAEAALGGWLAVDALGQIVLTVVSVLFFLVALYTVEFLKSCSPRGGRAFVSSLLGFLAAASLVSLSHHLALLWVGMETTTLTLAPLVYHRRDARSLEAVWKYLVLSSVGIGLALLGTFFLAAAQTAGRPLVLEDLVAHAGSLQPALLRGAFVFLLVGYGTKMGLAPLHSWKPDTYGEAPGLVGCLMAGALTTCAFLGLLRVTQVTMAAGLASFVQPLFLGFGLLSLVVAAAFMIGQLDLKRLLAYSSVEHMGLLVLGLGLGGLGAYGSVLHVLNNGLTKGLMFLAVSNVAILTGATQSGSRPGLLRRLPVSGVLLLIGLFAVTGSPPFGLFISEFTLLRAAIGGGHPWVAVMMVGLLAVIFVGMARPVLGMLFEPQENPEPPVREPPLLVFGPIVLGVVVLLLGIYIPAPLQVLLGEAARALGGVAP